MLITGNAIKPALIQIEYKKKQCMDYIFYQKK